MPLPKLLNNPKRLIAVWTLILPLFLLGCWQVGFKLRTAIDQKKLNSDFLEAMLLTTNWFITNQTKEGDFRYELSVDSNQPTSNYNIVRQAGSLYSLAQVYKYNRDPKLQDTLENGFSFFKALTIPEKEATAGAVIFQTKKQTNASALFLLALIEFLETNPSATKDYYPLAQQLANFLVSTQKDSGGFAYQPDVNQEESDYNNGETFYALTRMYLLSREPSYLNSARKAADHFLKYYTPSLPNMSFYSWGMAGFAYLYSIDPQESYWQFMRLSTDAVLTKQGKTLLSQSFLKGGWGVFLEGIAHVAWIAKEKDLSYFHQLKRFYAQALRNLLRLQVNGPFSSYTSDFENIRGGMCYDSLCQTQRIDITHHNLSAIYLYFTFLREKPS